MAPDAVDRDGAEAAEARRRRLLEESDELLDAVERLRLTDAGTVPDSVREALAGLQERLGRRRPAIAPATLRAAHSLVFAVQQRLMAANPRNPGTRAHAGRAAGAPRTQAVEGGTMWKVLTLPPRSAAASDEAWLELVDATADRALERWAYAQHQAARAARETGRPGRELATARVAWSNYFELTTEAATIRLRLRERRPAAPGPRPP